MDYSRVIKQKKYEKIIYLLRRDTITFIPQIFLTVVLFAAEYGIYFLLKEMFPQLFIKNISLAFLSVFAFIYTLSVWLFFYTAFVNYFLDMWIVTNDRIIDIAQKGLFSRTIAELDLFRVQDVTSEQHGLFATMFDFGNVFIQTAGKQERFIFHNVPEPHKIREAVIRLADEDRKYHNADIKDETV